MIVFATGIVSEVVWSEATIHEPGGHPPAGSPPRVLTTLVLTGHEPLRDRLRALGGTVAAMKKHLDVLPLRAWLPRL